MSEVGDKLRTNVLTELSEVEVSVLKLQEAVDSLLAPGAYSLETKRMLPPNELDLNRFRELLSRWHSRLIGDDR